MPLTPLHFGINGTISEVYPKKIDVLSCILANILLDVQPFLVIFFGLKTELHGISHTLIFAIVICAIFFTLYGIVVKKIFKLQNTLFSFTFGGILGGILHVMLDSFYHSDVKPFFPFSDINFAYLHLSDMVLTVCLIGYIIFFIIIFVKFIKSKTK